MSRKKKVWIGVGSIFFLLIAVVYYLAGPELINLVRAGYFDKAEKVKYSGNSEDNLKLLHAAMMSFHESEGVFPKAETWMDAIKNRVRTGNMEEEEAMKKFVDPDNPNPGDLIFGYAMNTSASEQYKDDVKGGSETILLFVVDSGKWNAHGKPEELLPKPSRSSGNLAITLEGKIVRIP